MSGYFIKIDPTYLSLGYRKHHAQLLTYIANWQKWKLSQGQDNEIILSTQKIAEDLCQAQSTVQRWIKELRGVAIICNKLYCDIVGGFRKRVNSYGLPPELPAVRYDAQGKYYSLVKSHFEINNPQSEENLAQSERGKSQSKIASIYKNNQQNQSTKPLSKAGESGQRCEGDQEEPCPIDPLDRSLTTPSDQAEPILDPKIPPAKITGNNMNERLTVEQQKELYQARRQSFRPIAWLEQGQANGLWQTKEELNSFRLALVAYARTAGKGEGWVVTVLSNIATQGMSTYWDEFKAGVPIGTIEQQGWEIAPGQTLPEFVSWLTQNLRQNGDNPADTMARVGREIKFNGKLHWEAFKRRLDREVEVQQQAERLGVTYMLPGELRPQQTPDDRTAHNAMAYLNQESVHQFNQRPLASSALKQICNSENKSPQPLPAADDSVLEQTLDGEIEPDIPPPPHVAAALEQIGITYHTPEPAAELEEVAPINQGEPSHKETFVLPTLAELKAKLAAKRDEIAKSTNNAVKEQQEADRAFERELGQECLRHRHDPATAMQWFSINRDQVRDWLSRRDQHDRDRWLRNNPWLNI